MFPELSYLRYRFRPAKEKLDSQTQNRWFDSMQKLTKKRHAVKMFNMPMVSPCQYEAAARAVKMIRIKVETNNEPVLDQWSEV